MFAPMAKFRERLEQGEVLLGTGIVLTDPQASEALAESVDFLWIDLEHSAMSPEALRGHLLVARGRNKPAFVRVPGSGAVFLKPVLDAGAHGVVVPQVRSVEEVEQVVADCRYSPRGQRGFGPLIPTDYGREGGPEYVARANGQLFVTVMIETAEALESIGRIVAVPGLDSVVIGPMDLSGSLGVLGEIEHPRVVAAMEEIVARARAAGVSVGAGMGVDAEYACTLARRGVQWIQMGGDCGHLVRSAEEVHGEVRRRLRAEGGAR